MTASTKRKTNAKAGGRKQSASSGRARWVFYILAFCLLAIFSFRFPSLAANYSHDPGSEMAAEFYSQAKYQFGVDVVQNIGPYGFLQYPRIYSGILPRWKIGFGILFPLVFVGAVLLGLQYFPNMPSRGLWLLCSFAIALTADADWDPTFYLFHLIAAHYLLTRERYKFPIAFDGIVLVTEGVLALTKSTNLLLASGIFGAAAIQSVAERRLKRLAMDTGFFAGTFLLFWVLAGQRLGNLWAFALGALTFTSGYNEAMATYQPHEERLVVLGIIVAILLAAMNVRRLSDLRQNSMRLLLGAVEFVILFFVWKHGHVRSDRALFFWCTLAAAAPLLFIAHEKHDGLDKWKYAGTLAVIVLCVAAFMSGAIVLPAIPDTQAARLERNMNWLLHGPSQMQAMKESLEKNRAEAGVPAIARAVGKSSIDQYGLLPGVPLLNNLTYKPRPMPITFAAVNERLQQMNARFYADGKTAPEYVMAMIGSIDNRLPAQDDAQGMLELLRTYTPIWHENNLRGIDAVLLKRLQATARRAEPVKISGTSAKWNQSIETPQISAGFVWCKVEIQSSLLGRIRAALYKPPPVYIVLGSHGKDYGRFKFVAAEGPTGFLIVPMIVTNTDLIRAYSIPEIKGDITTPTPDSIRFELDPSATKSFQENISVSFWKIES